MIGCFGQCFATKEPRMQVNLKSIVDIFYWYTYVQYHDFREVDPEPFCSNEMGYGEP